MKGTVEGLEESSDWFLRHPHLASYVRHVEFWVPVWGNRALNRTNQLPPSARRQNHNAEEDANAAAFFQTWNGNTGRVPTEHISRNASLQDIFEHVKVFFPGARILTIEGGHCKRPPMVRQFRNDPFGQCGRERLEVLPNIRTFIMRGAWNIMRDYQHWCNISAALPSLREWQCSYEKPKLEGYNTVARILLRLPPALQHVNIGLEGFFTKEPSSHHHHHHHHHFPFGDAKPHMCTLLGEAAPQLESLAYTGKACGCLFDRAQASAAMCRSPPSLKSIDLVVKTCCRERAKPPSPSSAAVLDDTTSITNMTFIQSFEHLTISAIRSLSAFPELNYVRIRFIDLDSACPLLNPYFQLVNNSCTGLWSAGILEALHTSRPEASFAELSDGIYPQFDVNHQVVGAIYPRSRPKSIQVDTYRILADASKI